MNWAYWILLVTAVCLILPAEWLGAQIQRRNVVGFSFVSLTMNKLVQTELQLTTDQVRQIEQIWKRHEQPEKEIVTVLQPQQFERLKQIRYQVQVKNRIVWVLSQGELAKELAVTEKQKENIQESGKAMDRELQEGTEQLHKESHEQVLSVLTEEQQATFENLLGKPFSFRGDGNALRRIRASPISAARNEIVQAELRLTVDQIQRIEDINEAFRKSLRLDSFIDYGPMTRVERTKLFEKFRRKLKIALAQAKKEIAMLLAPQQLERLQQIRYQAQTRYSWGFIFALSGGEFGQELAVTDEQKERIKNLGPATNRVLRKKTEQLRKEAQDKVISVLTEEQQARFKELLGKPFSFRDDARQQGDENRRKQHAGQLPSGLSQTKRVGAPSQSQK